MIEDWVEIDLGVACEIISGKNQKQVEDAKGKYPIYGSGGVFGFANEYLCESGTTVIGRKGTINNPIYVNQKFWNVDTAFGISPSKEIDSKFVYYFCKGFNFQKLDKSTTIPSLAKRDLLAIQFRLAPLPEQRAIVAKIELLFSELDNGIANLKAAKAKLEIYRQAVLKKAFEGELTKEWREQQMAGSEWKILQLRSIGDWKGGGTPSKGKSEFWENGTVLWVSPKDMKSDIITSTIDLITEESIQHSSAKWIEKGAILIVVRSGIIRRMLPVAIAGVRLTVNQDLQTIKPNGDFLSKYVFWYLRTNERAIRQNCAKDGTTVDNINVPILKKYVIPAPSIIEQSQIVQEIESRLSFCEKLFEGIDEGLVKSEALRHSVLKQAFEGRLLSEEELAACKKDADWEPADALLERIRNEEMKEPKL